MIALVSDISAANICNDDVILVVFAAYGCLFLSWLTVSSLAALMFFQAYRNVRPRRTIRPEILSDRRKLCSLGWALSKRCPEGRNMRVSIFFAMLLLCCGDIHPNPGPARGTNRHQQRDEPLTIYSCNVNSIIGDVRRLGLAATISTLKYPDIITLQETKIDGTVLNSELPFENYSIFRKDRTYGGGGVLIAVKNHLRVKALPHLAPRQAELIWLEVSELAQGHTVLIGTFYRPNCADLDAAIALSNSLALARTYADSHGSKICLTGDFNCPDIDWSEGGGTRLRFRGSRVIREALFDNSLTQLVTIPTRLENTLDLVCSSHPDLVSNLRLVPPLYGDHDGLAFNMMRQIPKPSAQPKPTFNWRRADVPAMRNQLQEFVDSYMRESPRRRLEENWIHMRDSFIDAMNDNIPKSVKKARARPIPRDVVRLCRQRDRAHKAMQLYPSVENRIRYNALRNRAKRECARAHRTHMNRLSEAMAEHNTKPFWRHVAGLRKEQVALPDIEVDGVFVSNPEEKAMVFNQKFQSVFTQEEPGELPFLPPPQHQMRAFAITTEGVERRLSQLIVTKATGPDKIPARFLQSFAPIISPAVARLYQQSLETGIIPSDWKMAAVHPIFKKGDKADALNYRPVSLTSILCKQLEHIIVSQMNGYLSAHNILYDRQHGFRAGQSCETALASLIHDWAGTVDPSFVSIDALLLDFAKAFDTVPHNRLLHKIAHMGIHPLVENWIRGFLSGRQQKVVISGSESTWLPVTSGIPQGSVLGPLLFSIFINDIHENLSEGTRLNLFADDCIVYRPILGKEDCRLLQDDMDIVSNWSRKWLLRFNVGKCAHMRVSLRAQTDQVIPIPDYKLCGEFLSHSTSEKYLGVTLQSNLKFDQHIDQTVSRCNSLIGLLRRNLGKCSPAAKRTAYIALVRSRLEYCCAIFDPYAISLRVKLEAVQNRGARFVARCYSRYASVSAIKRMHRLELLTVRRREARHKLVARFISGEAKIPGVQFGPNGRDIFPPVYRRETKNSILYRTFREIELVLHTADPRIAIPP